MPHFEQLTDNIYQGSYPEAQEQGVDFDLIINVSDCVCNSLSVVGGVKFLWFPVFEVGNWDYASFFGTKRAIDHQLQIKPDSKILIHCSAGAYRSVIVATAYLLSHDHYDCLTLSNSMTWKMFKESERCPIGLELFLQTMNEFPTYAICGILNQCNLMQFNYAKRKKIILATESELNDVF